MVKETLHGTQPMALVHISYVKSNRATRRITTYGLLVIFLTMDWFALFKPKGGKTSNKNNLQHNLINFHQHNKQTTNKREMKNLRAK